MKQIIISWGIKQPVYHRLERALRKADLQIGFDFEFVEEERKTIIQMLKNRNLAFEEIGSWVDDHDVEVFCMSVCENPALLSVREAER